jgi:hypothetical protein
MNNYVRWTLFNDKVYQKNLKTMILNLKKHCLAWAFFIKTFKDYIKIYEANVNKIRTWYSYCNTIN